MYQKSNFEEKMCFGREQIQRQVNWCWAVACEMVGNQYKKNTPDIYSSQKFVVCANQETIVQNANTIMPGFLGNFPGDDLAKVRGLKYVITGDCDSHLIEVANVGSYDMKESLFDFYREEMEEVFRCKNYIIGNAVLFPDGICHSFVLIGMDDDMVQVYDPWNGNVKEYRADEVFESGFQSILGKGVIKWVQHISVFNIKENLGCKNNEVFL